MKRTKQEQLIELLKQCVKRLELETDNDAWLLVQQIRRALGQFSSR